MSTDGLAAVNAEMKRTAVQKKAVSKLPPKDVLAFAIQFFKARGYRAAATGRPNVMFVMRPAEGALPRVTGEIAARADVGKPGTTLVTLDAIGERLGPAMNDFIKELRALGRTPKPPPPAPPMPIPEP